MTLRRLSFLVVACAAAFGLAVLLATALGSGGWSGERIAIMVCAIGVLPWFGICVGNGLAGFAIAVLARDPARYALPAMASFQDAPITKRTALAVTVRNEDISAVLQGLRALLDAIEETGWGDQFAGFILSDTQEPALVATEEAAIASVVSDRRISYRRRSINTGFKAGNVMDFLDHHATGMDFAVMLDADSWMSADAVLRLVRIMQAAPRIGIVQHLTVGLPAQAAFPRLFQFNMRAGMRIWALGQAWWQGDEGPYWGHNAILRIAPFRENARLEKLPHGRDILSHDQVEAAQLRAAGWGVCVWADEDGSAEQNPPALPEFFRRDERWMAGNIQYRHLLTRPGLRPMGRWQLVQAILLFATAPLLPLMLLLAAIDVAAGGGAGTPWWMTLSLAAAWLGGLYAPKLLGYVEVLLHPSRRRRYGGGWHFAMGVLAETVFTLLLDAIGPVQKSLAMARLLTGAPPGWLPQNRGERGVTWKEAARLLWPHTLFGLLVFGLLAHGSWGAALWALPFAFGLVVAIPFCVLTADARFSAWLRRHGIAAIPEELGYAGSSYRGMNQSAGSDEASSYHAATSECARTAAQ
jgi:membrane glycosyltransferase